MSLEGAHILAGKRVPNLDGLIIRPTGDVATVGTERYAMNIMRMCLESDSFLAGDYIPDPDGAVTRPAGDAAPVGTECHTINLTGMSLETLVTLDELPVEIIVFPATQVLLACIEVLPSSVDVGCLPIAMCQLNFGDIQEPFGTLQLRCCFLALLLGCLALFFGCPALLIRFDSLTFSGLSLKVGDLFVLPRRLRICVGAAPLPGCGGQTEDEDGRNRSTNQHARLVFPREFPGPIRNRRRRGDDRLVVQMPLDVGHQGRGGVVTQAALFF